MINSVDGLAEHILQQHPVAVLWPQDFAVLPTPDHPRVTHGQGRMRQPVRVLVNGRATHACGGESVPVRVLVEQTVTEFFAERLPDLAGHVRVEHNVTVNPSPGAVITGEEPSDRSIWFRPRSVSDLRERRVLLSNDTSLGTGWAPEHPVETFVRELADHLSRPDRFGVSNPWVGTEPPDHPEPLALSPPRARNLDDDHRNPGWAPTPCHRTGLVPRPLRATAPRLPRHGHAPKPTDR